MLGIERPGDMPDPVHVEGRWRAAVEDAVDVVALDRGEARVESLGHDLRREDGDGRGFRWALVASRTVSGRHSFVQVHMHDLMVA